MALLPTLLATPFVYGVSNDGLDQAAFRLNLEHWFSDHKALRRVATQVVNDQYFSIYNAEQLMTDIMNQYEKGGEVQVRKYLSDRIERDFLLERCCVLDGWVLAETEATLSVLVSRA